MAKLTGNPTDIQNHKAARKEARKSWKTARNDHFHSLANNFTTTGSFKDYWKIINANLKKNKHFASIPTLSVNNIDYLTSIEKANCLNDHFTSTIPSSGSYSDSLVGCRPFLELYFNENNICILEETIYKELTSIKPSSSSGPDNISNQILIKCADSLCYPLS